MFINVDIFSAYFTESVGVFPNLTRMYQLFQVLNTRSIRSKSRKTTQDNQCPQCSVDFERVDIRYNRIVFYEKALLLAFELAGVTGHECLDSADRLVWNAVHCGIPLLSSHATAKRVDISCWKFSNV